MSALVLGKACGRCTGQLCLSHMQRSTFTVTSQSALLSTQSVWVAQNLDLEKRCLKPGQWGSRCHCSFVTSRVGVCQKPGSDGREQPRKVGLFPLDTSHFPTLPYRQQMTLRGGGGGLLWRCHSEQSIEQRRQARDEGRCCIVQVGLCVV